MDRNAVTYQTIDEYISHFSPELQEKLAELRKVVKDSAPAETEETISYRMPAFRLNGKVLVYFAAFKDHLSFFPTGSGVAAFADELGAYKISKGTIQLPLDQPVPHDLVSRIVKYRVAEVVGQTGGKAKK